MKLFFTYLIALTPAFLVNTSTPSSSSLFRDCDMVLTENRRINGQVYGKDEIFAKSSETTLKPKQKHKRTDEELASGALWQGILSLVLTATILLIPVGFFVGLFAVAKGKKVLKTTKRRSKFKKIRRRARWGILLGSISMLLSVGFIIWFINVLGNAQFPDFEFSDLGWSWIYG